MPRCESDQEAEPDWLSCLEEQTCRRVDSGWQTQGGSVRRRGSLGARGPRASCLRISCLGAEYSRLKKGGEIKPIVNRFWETLVTMGTTQNSVPLTCGYSQSLIPFDSYPWSSGLAQQRPESRHRSPFRR